MSMSGQITFVLLRITAHPAVRYSITLFNKRPPLAYPGVVIIQGILRSFIVQMSVVTQVMTVRGFGVPKRLERLKSTGSTRGVGLWNTQLVDKRWGGLSSLALFDVGLI